MSKKTDALSKLGEFFPPVNKNGIQSQCSTQECAFCLTDLSSLNT